MAARSARARTAPRTPVYAGPYAALVNPAAVANGLDPALLAAVLYVENRFRPTGDSPAGAVGVAQIQLSSHPDVTRAQAENPAFAIPYAARLLAHGRDRSGTIAGALRAYNTGSPDPSPAGTAYVDQVTAAYRDLRGTAAGPAAAAAGVYPLGVQGKIIGLPYQGSHRDFGNWESDNAIDIAAPVGTPVYAVEPGTIGPQIGPLDSANPQLAGERLHLQTAGNEWYYAHLSKIVVQPGQQVEAGQLLGYSGSANGVAHLHLAQRAGAAPDDTLAPPANPATFQPASWLGGIGHGIGSVIRGAWPGNPAGLGGGFGVAPGVSGTAGAAANAAKGLIKPAEAVGAAASQFLADPSYPFLWLLALLFGVALMWVGFNRLFGGAPARAVASVRQSAQTAAVA